MTVYPFEIDSDADLIRVDDNITEIGGEAINQLRDAVFAIEKELGIGPAGSAGSVAARLDTSLNADGSIKASALASVGLATLPISDSQVGSNAGIKEYKLALDHSTSDLNTLIVSNTALLNALTAFTSETNSNLLTHISGGTLLIDGSPARHVSSQIDLNQVPTDSRDPLFTWSGLFNKDGVQRSASNVTQALDQINTDLINHENATADAHVATAVNLDTDNFDEIPTTVDTVQKLADHIDDFEVITIADHRATQHANGIPKIGRVSACSLPDGYGQNVVANTPVDTFLVRSPNITPVDSISNGDDIISFLPIDNSDFSFDAQFSQVRIGDDIRVNYGSGFEASFKVESIRFTPGSEWIVRINGVNLMDSSDGYASARIDRPLFDRDTSGILAVAAANATPSGDFDTILQSVIVGHPRGAVALGNGFDAGQLDGYHYNLWLELYPTGNPADRVISLPAIDVTGNAGTTVGKYTLDSVVHETNKKLREIGYNYRFIAFADHGNFGIMLADAISCASFSITSGDISLGSLNVGTYSENVIGDAAVTGFDALGFGNTHADLASPAYGATFADSTIAQLPTKVIVPFKSRDYIVDGKRRDNFAPTWQATEDINGDGYWDGYITDRTIVGAFTVETTYSIPLDLKAAELKPGKTIVVQPAFPITDARYYDVDYGRFIIKSVTFPPACPGDPDQTQITVISGIHAAGTGVAFSSSPTLPVKLYFSEDSVSFNDENVIDSTPSADKYHRLHEIFIDKNGKTFSHERGRMIVQGESLSPPLLRTGFGTGTWHIQDISPKLRGYRDNSTTFNKYLRFYILTYDTTSGEYTGYIGKRDPSSDAILSTGPVTTGRKNVPTRFYDETNVDYIDLVFVDESPTSAGVAILTTAVARYVDIEVFDSLQLNDDIMLLATTEVNWDPVTGQEVIQRVVNRREFGSVDEEDFTESAIDFITAGDRELHENGILRGFDFDSVVVDEIFYKGGVSLVNGKVLTTNALSVTIPELYEDGTSKPQDVDWAVCVNEEGFLEPILITGTKNQFWARDNVSGSTYYVPSVTFAELVDTRKDLTPISVVTATIASITIGSSDVLDVRRFIDDGKKRELVYSPENMAGTFHTADALVNWVNSYASSAPLVAKMRGEIDVSTTQDFTGLTHKLILDGDGAVFDVTADIGIQVRGNLTIRNVEFNYNPDTAAMGFSSADDKINSINGGCVYGSVSSALAPVPEISDISVERCTFNSDVDVGFGTTGQRPPFIVFEINKERFVKHINIEKNKFNDSGGDVAGTQTAFAIVSKNDSSDTEPAIVYDARIKDNVCNQKQGIYILQEEDDYTGTDAQISGPGIRTYDTIISGNSCGVVGFLVTSIDTSESFVGGKIDSLIIKNNVCLIIGQMVNYIYSGNPVLGTSITRPLFTFIDPFPTGNVDIQHNSCNTIEITRAASYTSGSVANYCKTTIESNRITATDPAILNDWANYFRNFGTTPYQYSGIRCYSYTTEESGAVIANNIITKGVYSSAITGPFVCLNAIIVWNISSSITGNVIHGIGPNGTGIQVWEGNTNNTRYVISSNNISRDNEVIDKYIYLGSSNGGGLVVDNVFDDYTVNGTTDDEVITGTGTSPGTRYEAWVIERNKNQTDVMQLPSSAGTFSYEKTFPSGSWQVVRDSSEIGASGVYGPNGWGVSSVGLQFDDIIFTINGADPYAYMLWQFYMREIVPNGVEIIDFEYTLDMVTTPAAGSRANLSIASINDTQGEVTADYDLVAHGGGGNHTVALSSIPLQDRHFTHPGSRTIVSIRIDIASGASPQNLRLRDILVTYRW